MKTVTLYGLRRGAVWALTVLSVPLSFRLGVWVAGWINLHLRDGGEIWLNM